MNQLDPNTLFSIFEANDELIYKEHQVEDLLNNPYVLMGMVIRGLENFNIIDMMYSKSYPEQYEKIRFGIKKKYYNGLYGYLTRIKLEDSILNFKVGESFDKREVTLGLTTLLLFYENLEEYEKCAVIKKYIDLI